MKIIIGLVILIVILCICRTRNAYAATTVGNRDWFVIKDYENHAAAAKLLADVNTSMITLMRDLRNKYKIDAPTDVIVQTYPNDIYNIVDNLLNNYNPDVFYENDPMYSTETSFTVKKGEAMYLCLRDKKDPKKLVNKDILLFVMLHEASHIANYRGWGHGKDFWEVFAFILHEAQLSGIYHPIDYAKKPEWYCGLYVEYNPLFDPSLKKIWI